MNLNDLDSLLPEQRALVLRVGRELNDAGIDFVLAVGEAEGEAGHGHVMSNMCSHCAMNLLGGALAGAMEKVDREAGHVPHGTVQ